MPGNGEVNGKVVDVGRLYDVRLHYASIHRPTCLCGIKEGITGRLQYTLR